jgi:hypothetical protein
LSFTLFIKKASIKSYKHSKIGNLFFAFWAISLHRAGIWT